MISSGHHIDALGMDYVKSVVSCVENNGLICAFAGLALHVIHKAATEDEDFGGGRVDHAGVPGSSLHYLV